MEPFDDSSPIYLQIADRIRRSVLSGELREGDQVMSTTQYATTHRINPATAAKAMGLLVDEGLIHKRRGIGMFVSDGAREQLRTARRESYWEQVMQPALDDARALGITTDEIIIWLKETS